MAFKVDLNTHMYTPLTYILCPWHTKEICLAMLCKVVVLMINNHVKLIALCWDGKSGIPTCIWWHVVAPW